MALPCCTIWRMGAVESTQHEGEPPLHQSLHGRQRCWQTLAHANLYQDLHWQSRAGTSLCSCTWRWEPCKPEDEAATERWKTLSEEKKVFLHQAILSSHQAGSWGTLSVCIGEPVDLQYFGFPMRNKVRGRVSEAKTRTEMKKIWEVNPDCTNLLFRIFAAWFLSSTLSFFRKKM